MWEEIQTFDHSAGQRAESERPRGPLASLVEMMRDRRILRRSRHRGRLFKYVWGDEGSGQNDDVGTGWERAIHACVFLSQGS